MGRRAVRRCDREPALSDSPLRIALVVPYDLREEGGVKRHACHLAERLRRDGDHAIVVGPLSGGDGAAGIRGFGGVVNVPANGADNRMALLTSPWSVRRFFREAAFDVVHVHEPMVPLLPWYATRFSAGAARVCTFHMFAEQEGRVARAGRVLTARWLLPSFERAIAVSEPAAAFIGPLWSRWGAHLAGGRQPLVVIPNGVPTRTFTPAPTRGGDGPLRLLFVGHLRDPRKGLKHLLAALARLRAGGLQVVLDVVGSGGTPGLAEPGVTFHGAVASEEQLARHYRACDVFVAPSTGQESFGIVLLEAMACARPVVCSDIAGYRQVVGGAGARLVPPGQPEALAAALAELARDPDGRCLMGELNRRRAEVYDWDEIAARVRREYVLAVAAVRGRRK